MQFYRVKNWERFQHYRDRNPPWIKLHFELLSSSDWVALDDASRVLAIACMLIASRNNGNVPSDPHYMLRVAYLNRLPKFKPLIDCGFLEIPQADASVLQADARPETYSKKEETEKESKPPNPQIPDFVPTADWQNYVEMRAKIRKPMTARAIGMAFTKLAELQAEGHSPAEVLQNSVFNSYQGLFPPSQPKGNKNDQRSKWDTAAEEILKKRALRDNAGSLDEIVESPEKLR